MPRASKTITFSLPPEMADGVEKLMKEEGRTKSELLREALRRYVEDRERKQVLRYGEDRARERGLAPAAVERLVDEYRAEAT
ncbi:MAG: ribbon-helix-helix protein, CopG family [Chloroflexi bacterium]|nr:ribbon-helix-helix protein, CopG family [Chloroflexota bacterium]